MTKRLQTLCVIMLCASAYAQETSYTLKDLFTIAYENPHIHIAVNETQQASQTVKEAIGASFPSVSAGLYGQYEANPLTTDDIMPGFTSSINDIINGLNSSPLMASSPISTITSTDPTKWSALFSAELTQPLFTWGKIASSISLARLGLEATQIQQVLTEKEIQTNIVVQAAGVYYMQGIRNALIEQRTALQRIRNIAQQSLQSGMLLATDIQGIDIQLAETNAVLAQFNAAIDSAIYTLQEYTQVYDIDGENIDFSFIPEDNSALSRQHIEDALRFIRTDSSQAALLNLHIQMSDEQKDIIASQAWAKPNIGLKLGFTYSTKSSYEDSDNLSFTDLFRWNFTAAIAMNSTLFNGGQTLAQVKKAELETEKALLEQQRSLGEIERNLKELDSSIQYKTAYRLFYEQKVDYAANMLAIKQNELRLGYIEEQDYLALHIENLGVEIQKLQNDYSLLCDYCMYNYLCGAFPDTYLHINGR